jgi:hypothetical protein
VDVFDYPLSKNRSPRNNPGFRGRLHSTNSGENLKSPTVYMKRQYTKASQSQAVADTPRTHGQPYSIHPLCQASHAPSSATPSQAVASEARQCYQEDPSYGSGATILVGLVEGGAQSFAGTSLSGPSTTPGGHDGRIRLMLGGYCGNLSFSGGWLPHQTRFHINWMVLKAVQLTL